MTTEADPAMTANNVSAFRAFPFFRFLLEEAPDTVLSDKFHVFYHAQMIKSSVPFIERFHATAGIISTLVAIADKPFTHEVAVFAHVRTILAARTATRAI
jgi:hypothetical protein